MLITDRIKNLCLFKLTDEEVVFVEKALDKQPKALENLIEFSNYVTETTRAILEEIIDLIGSLFKYGNDEIETVLFENFRL